jgi:hypothetical protein
MAGLLNVVAGTWDVSVTSADGDAQGSVELQFTVGAAGLQGSAMGPSGDDAQLEHVSFDPASGSLSFEQKASPGHPKVVWRCTVEDGAVTTAFRVGRILSKYVVVGSFSGVKLGAAGRERRRPISAPRLLLNLDRDHALAAAVFPTTLDDSNVRDQLPEDEVDELIALSVFQAIVDKELVANVPSVLLELRDHICETDAIADDAFHEWLSESRGGDRFAMFQDLVASIRKQWAETQAANSVRREDAAAIDLVERVRHHFAVWNHRHFFLLEVACGLMSCLSCDRAVAWRYTSHLGRKSTIVTFRLTAGTAHCPGTTRGSCFPVSSPHL